VDIRNNRDAYVQLLLCVSNQNIEKVLLRIL